ncbi:MAG: hypothetical protein HZA16_13475 [Nitrospirae bacterium]|nr:hypothetical protein [Nitrospirota bacterium]
MINNENILQAVIETIDELNGQLPKEQRLEKSADTALFGNEGPLDSLGLVSLITTLEQKIEEKSGKPVTILEELEALENENPFETVRTLVAYVASSLEQRGHE